LPDISIIIVNYKGWKKLAQCLDSLSVIEDSRYSLEVIIVDNQSNDGQISIFRQLYPKFTFIINSGNLGFASGCNLGAGNSHGSFLLFLNPDTIITSEAIFLMLAEVRERAAFSIISCQQVKEDGSNERHYGKFLTVFTLTGWLRALNYLAYRRRDELYPQTENYIYPDWVSGSVIMISKNSFDRLGGWDEDYWMYFEDVDLCRRARQRNGDIVKLKNVTVEHNHGGSSRINPQTTALTKTEVNISRHVYISKHETGWRACYMHAFLILDNILFGFLPAIAGSVLFFIRRLNINSRIYIQLVRYYLNGMQSGTWLSRRSVNYNKRRELGTGK
jgi:GT2 family glycosyltransferase